jgi:hypothetical protein
MTYYNSDERLYYKCFNQIYADMDILTCSKKPGDKLQNIFNEDVVLRRALFKGADLDKLKDQEAKYFTENYKNKNNADNDELKLAKITSKFQMQDLLIGLMTRELRNSKNDRGFINLLLNIEDNTNRHIISPGGFFKILFVSDLDRSYFLKRNDSNQVEIKTQSAQFWNFHGEDFNFCEGETYAMLDVFNREVPNHSSFQSENLFKANWLSYYDMACSLQTSAFKTYNPDRGIWNTNICILKNKKKRAKRNSSKTEKSCSQESSG